jgi:two-component system NtrC family sensor kinase
MASSPTPTPPLPDKPSLSLPTSDPKRFWSAALVLAMGFGVVSLLSNLVESTLELVPGTPAMLGYDLALAVGLTLIGALILRRVLRPIEGELRTGKVRLARVQEELAAVIEAAPIAIMTLDASGNVTEVWNPAAEQMFGWTREEVQGRPAPFVPPDKVAEFDRHRAQALTGRPLPGVAAVRIRKDGSAIHVRLHTGLIPPDDLRAPGIVALIVDETQRIRDQEAMAFQSAIIAQLDDPVIAFDERFEVTFWNSAAERLYGWTAAEMMGTYANARLDLQPVGKTLDDVREGLRRDGVFRGEFRQLRRDGTRVHVEARSVALRDAEGRVRGYITANRDLTERRAIEAALRESEARYRRLADHAPDVIYRYRVRPDRGFDYVSPAIEAVSGYTQQDFYDNPDMAVELLPPEARHVIETLGTRPEELEGKPIVLPWRRKDGTTAWVEQRNVLVRDEAGTVVAFEGVARDISERKALEDRYARLSQVVEQAAEVVLVTDLEANIVYVNPAFERVTGYPAAEALGRNPRILRSGLQDQSVYAELWGALKRGESWTGRVRNRRKDGSLYVADVVISPVRDGSGAVTSYVGLQRDVSREAELDEQLRQAQKMEAVGQLTGGIAHDFNNLLTIILANAALLEEQVDALPGNGSEYLPEILAAARRGSEMVRKLLAFTRQERLQPRPVLLGALVAEFRSSLGRMLPATIELRAELPEAMPAALADPGAVEQILLNLATNARDAMPLGGTIELRLQTSEFDAMGDRSVSGWHQPGRFVHLAFKDTGTGMAPADLERIFDPFFTTKPTGKGSGLGMPMVYGLMKQHGGFVTVNSSPGAGTTVHLHFPVADAPDAAPARKRIERAPVPAGGLEVILLVEDEEPIRRVATRVLQSLGYHVLTASDGLEALDIWRANQATIDLVLTDVVMPRLKGPGLVARIREEGGRARVLFATGYASTDVMTEHALAAEDVHFIEKPWTMDQLATRVREALRPPDP